MNTINTINCNPFLNVLTKYTNTALYWFYTQSSINHSTFEKESIMSSVPLQALSEIRENKTDVFMLPQRDSKVLKDESFILECPMKDSMSGIFVYAPVFLEDDLYINLDSFSLWCLDSTHSLISLHWVLILGCILKKSLLVPEVECSETGFTTSPLTECSSDDVLLKVNPVVSISLGFLDKKTYGNFLNFTFDCGKKK